MTKADRAFFKGLCDHIPSLFNVVRAQEDALGFLYARMMEMAHVLEHAGLMEVEYEKPNKKKRAKKK